jgi:DNA polymerase III subunit gamma/tau
MDHLRSTDGSNHDASGQPTGEYVVIARRYRPQAFGELIGQEHVARALAAAIETSRVGHAYLFTGARGTGKTSTARILAKALNCIHGPTPTPCNECEQCISITNGSHLDVREIDGASNRGIDEVRKLRDEIRQGRATGRFKIYIIDEVHMLTKEAFNALLKTLEEPPEHVKFIFCTTEPEKIPITILSRCQRFDFAGIQTKQIVERLRQIVEGEHGQAEPEALELLARRAAGSMRDSQSLLEQLIAFGSTHITVADVHRLLGTAGADRIDRLVKCLVERQAAAALAEVNRAASEGVDIGQLLDQLLGYFRDVMATAVGCPADSLLNVSPSEQAGVQEAAGKMGLETILAVLQILDQTLSRIKYLSHPRIVAELALVRICQLEDLDSLPQLITELRQTGGEQSQAGSVAGLASKKKYDAPLTDSVTGAPQTVVANNGKDSAVLPQSSIAMTGNGHVKDEVGNNGHQHDAADINRDVLPAEITQTHASPLPTSLDAISIWRQAAEKLGGLAAEKANQASSAAILAPNQLVVTFPKKYNFCKQFCERPEIVGQIAEHVCQLVGRRMQLNFATEQETTPSETEPVRRATTRQRIYEVSQRPFARRAMELFDASPQRLEEPGTA